MRITTTIAASLLIASTTGTALAGDDEILSIGDQAPALDVAHWMKLGPNMSGGLTEFEDGNVYVVEFWATWCGPCKRGMPHVSEIQERFADYDVSIIGISDEPLATVFNFMTQQDKEGVAWTDKARYTLATDPDRSAHFDFMTRAGQNGIPTAFIVGKTGQIEWIGNPGYPPGEFDETLNSVVRDTWDRAAFAAKHNEKIAPQREAIIQRVKLERARRSGDWNTVLSMVDGMLEKQPDNLGLKVEKLKILAMQLDRPREAFALGHEMLDANWNNAGLMNQLAWMTATDERIKRPDYDFSMKAASRAAELTDHEEPAILDTLARVYYEQGNMPEAIKWQAKAAELAAGTPMETDLKAALDKYKGEMAKLTR